MKKEVQRLVLTHRAASYILCVIYSAGYQSCLVDHLLHNVDDMQSRPSPALLSVYLAAKAYTVSSTVAKPM